jgi:hypothetical protein
MTTTAKTPMTVGQFGLLFPAAYFVNYMFLGDRDWFGLFTPATVDQIIANEKKFHDCFASVTGAAYCGGGLVTFLVVFFAIGGTLYTWLRKGSLAANWVNVGLAAALAIAMLALGARSSFTVAIAAGWLLFGAIGLFDAYKAKGAAAEPPPAAAP